MKFLTTEINHVKNPMYERLLNAWEKSVVANTQSEYERAYLNPEDYPQCHHSKNSYLANSVKLNYWAERIKKESGNICLIDGDTVVLKDVSHVFDQDFDIAYTLRSKGSEMPVNGGVIFVKPSELVNDFFEKWVLTNNEMLVNQALHRHWYARYKGMNQASFGYMMERYKTDLKIIPVPCSKYNACDRSDWININHDTHILHVKSELRVACLRDSVPKQYRKAYEIWKQYDY
jgi:hypothetical protein